jgi:hypothetical protein
MLDMGLRAECVASVRMGARAMLPLIFRREVNAGRWRDMNLIEGSGGRLGRATFLCKQHTLVRRGLGRISNHNQSTFTCSFGWL